MEERKSEERAGLEWKVMGAFSGISHQNISQAHKWKWPVDRHIGCQKLRGKCGWDKLGSHQYIIVFKAKVLDESALE